MSTRTETPKKCHFCPKILPTGGTRGVHEKAYHRLDWQAMQTSKTAPKVLPVPGTPTPLHYCPSCGIELHSVQQAMQAAVK